MFDLLYPISPAVVLPLPTADAPKPENNVSPVEMLPVIKGIYGSAAKNPEKDDTERLKAVVINI